MDAGAVLALTGTGSYYGKTMSRGLDLAAKHIEAAGGPKINLVYLDHKSGDAAAGKAAITELGNKHVPAKFASYGDDLTVMLDGTAQYKIFTFDGGGGTGVVAQGKPYFWYPCHHPEPPAAGTLRVHQDRRARRQVRGGGLLGPRRAEQHHHQERHPEEDHRRRVHHTTASTSTCRSGTRTSPRCCPRSRPTSPTSCCFLHLRPGHRLVHQPGGHRRAQRDAVRGPSSRPTV